MSARSLVTLCGYAQQLTGNLQYGVGHMCVCPPLSVILSFTIAHTHAEEAIDVQQQQLSALGPGLAEPVISGSAKSLLGLRDIHRGSHVARVRQSTTITIGYI